MMLTIRGCVMNKVFILFIHEIFDRLFIKLKLEIEAKHQGSDQQISEVTILTNLESNSYSK